MGKHETPPDPSEGDGRAPDEIDIAELLKQQKGKHAADDEDEDEE